jgi:hypothetical protein
MPHANRPWPLRQAQAQARKRAAALGHDLRPFVALCDTLASTECRDPRCGMGVTVKSDAHGGPALICGSAVVFRCVGKPNRRTLRYG